MADLRYREQLQPSLLDRLTDDEPSRQVESAGARSMSMHELKASVLRDLGWLLNTTNFECVQDLERLPLVAESVINYGIPELTGVTLTSIDVPTLERQVREAIARFEPRILPESVRVRAVMTPGLEDRNALMFEIAGELWAEPVPERLFLMTQVDLETGDFLVKEKM